MRSGHERAEILARLALVASSVCFALLMMLLGMRFAAAHSMDEDSTGGGEIRWEEYTRYDAEHRFGVDEWNALGSATIRRSQSDANVEFRDYRDCGDGVLARWMPGSGADLIAFNVCEMDKISAFDRRATAVHEVGHALGLSHPSGAERASTGARTRSCTTALARPPSTHLRRTTGPTTIPCGPGCRSSSRLG